MQPRALQRGPDSAVTNRAAPPSPSGRKFASAQTWHLVELLGRGGGAHVWRAVDHAGRSVALKIPHAPLGSDADASMLSLTREHSLLAALAHDHVVATLGLVAHGGTTALALEYLPGGDLVALAGAHPRHWIDAARGVHAALAHLHARGFVHRDVKARNVLFGADGRARLIDFASVLPRGALAGRGGTTAAHCAPGRRPDAAEPRDDAYAFAVLLYELLAGRLPHGIAGRTGAAGEAAAAWPAPAGADPAAAALVERVLEVLGSDGAGLSVFTDVLESAAAAYR
jgi:serine/threonine protein kinase